MLPWVWSTNALPLVAQPHIHPAAQSPKRTEVIDGELVVTFAHVESDIVNLYKFTGGITAKYGPTTIFADQLTLNVSPDRKYGEAVGHVRLEDPEGTARATRLIFNWKEKTGSAFNVHTDVEGVKVDAREIDIKPGKWDIQKYLVHSC